MAIYHALTRAALAQAPLRRRAPRGSMAFAALFAAVAVLIGCGSAMAAAPAPAVSPGYLFSIPTASGSLTGRSDRHLTLRLTGARDYLTRFTDRPLREAFVVANVDFARRFKSYFAGSDPNAVLTYTPSGAHIPVSIVLTLGQPRWNAHHDTWTFPATRIRKQPDNLPGTTVHIKPPHIPNPHSFTQATLLIDNSAENCVPQPDTHNLTITIANASDDDLIVSYQSLFDGSWLVAPSEGQDLPTGIVANYEVCGGPFSAIGGQIMLLSASGGEATISFNASPGTTPSATVTTTDTNGLAAAGRLTSYPNPSELQYTVNFTNQFP